MHSAKCTVHTLYSSSSGRRRASRDADAAAVNGLCGLCVYVLSNSIGKNKGKKENKGLENVGKSNNKKMLRE